MMKKSMILLLSLFLALGSIGCLGPKQMDEYGYVLSIGIDKGKQKKYLFSFMLQDTTAQSGESMDTQSPAVILGAEGDTIFESITTLVAGLPYELSLTRTNVIIVSDEVARKGEMGDLLSVAFGALYIRPSVKMIVVLGKAMELQKGLQSPNSPNLTKLLYSVMQNYQQEGIIPMMNYTLFTEAITTERFDAAMPLCRMDENIDAQQKAERKEQAGEEPSKENAGSSTEGIQRYGGMSTYAMGAALFDGKRMAGVLNGEETKYLIMARGELERAYITYSYPDGNLLAIRLTQWKKPKITMETKSLRAHVEVYLTCDIDLDTSGEAEAKWEQGTKDVLGAFIVSRLEGMFTLCQGLNSDAVGFGREASRFFIDGAKWKDYNWKARYPQLQVDFSAVLRLYDINIGEGMA